MSTIFCETIFERLKQVTNKATCETVPGQMFMLKIKKKITLELSKKIHKLSAAHYISFFSLYATYLNYTCPDLN